MKPRQKKGKIDKLVCDRCGRELLDRYDIELALQGQRAWETAVKARGAEPRGIIPCKNYARCSGEMLALQK